MPDDLLDLLLFLALDGVRQSPRPGSASSLEARFNVSAASSNAGSRRERRTLRGPPRPHRHGGRAPDVRGRREAVFHRQAPHLQAHARQGYRRARPLSLRGSASNGKIRDALLSLAQLAEGDLRTRRLFATRITALESVRALAPFEPRLIGSVSTGHIRRGSDIDLQVFTPDPDALENHLNALGWAFEREPVTIQKFGEIREYLHFHVVDVFALELTVYEPRELRFRPRSSTDGKPIVRMGEKALEALLLKDHGEPWSRSLVTGEVEGMEELLSEADEDESAPRAGPWDGLIASGPDNDAPIAGEPGEEDDPEESYDALPGFEAFG